jgi:peptide/nickel transport system substrate-binding protein
LVIFYTLALAAVLLPYKPAMAETTLRIAMTAARATPDSIVHDLNPRAMSPKVKGFVSPQSWFLDLTLVSLQ